MPVAAADDYWEYRRRILALPSETALVVGDSVPWGESVWPGGAFPALLSHRTGIRFANAALPGLTLQSMPGLLHHSRPAFSRRKLLLVLNLLEFASGIPARPRQHPELFPSPWPASRLEVESSLDAFLHRHLEIFQWRRHMRYRMSGAIHLDSTRAETVLQRRLPPSPLGLHWPAELDTLAVIARLRFIQESGADLFILVPPLNPAHLTADAREDLARFTSTLSDALSRVGIPSAGCSTREASLFLDLAHFTPSGHQWLGECLANDPSFAHWLESPTVLQRR